MRGGPHFSPEVGRKTENETFFLLKFFPVYAIILYKKDKKSKCAGVHKKSIQKGEEP